MTREEIIDGLEIYTVGRSNKAIVHITVEELQKFIEAIKALEQEPSGDAISREGALEPYKILDDDDTLCVAVIRANILQQPPVTPQSKTGHWISHYDEDAKEGWYECDRCHTERAFNTDYCPDCGARMIEREDKE